MTKKKSEEDYSEEGEEEEISVEEKTVSDGKVDLKPEIGPFKSKI